MNITLYSLGRNKGQENKIHKS